MQHKVICFCMLLSVPVIVIIWHPPVSLWHVVIVVVHGIGCCRLMVTPMTVVLSRLPPFCQLLVPSWFIRVSAATLPLTMSMGCTNVVSLVMMSS